VLKEGQIVESGNLKELLATGGVFASMWAEQVAGDEGFSGAPPTGDVKGYDLEGSTQKAESSKKASSVSAPEHAPEPTLVEEPPQAPFLAPGPVITSLPPTEKELQAASQDNKSEHTTKDTTTADDASAVPTTYADAVKAASVKEPSIKAPSTQVQAPSVKAPSTQVPVPSVHDQTTSVVEDLNSVKDLSLHEPTASIAPSVKNESVAPGTYAAAVTDEPESTPSAPIAFPTSAPVAFPTSDDASSTHRRMQSSDSVPTVASPGVTFAGAESPLRAGTPDDPEKRKRTASQNFQRLARRISIGRRPSAADPAAIIAAFKGKNKDDTGSKEGSS
jgi:hypothetical protein